MLTAGDIMTDMVIRVKANLPIYKAVSLLAKNHISCLPVVDDEEYPIGIINEKNLLMLINGSREDENRTVGDFMDCEIASFDENTDLLCVCDYLVKSSYNAVPITSHGQLVGVVSIADVIEFIIQRELKRYYIY